MKRVLAILLLLGPVPGITAPVQPLVRVTVTPEVVAIGESAQMQVTVLVPTWFPRPPVFPSFELANAITRLPPDSAYPTSERVGAETWSGIVRDYRVYPLLGASYRLSGQTIAVTYTDPQTRKAVSVDVAVPDIEFLGTVPAGAEGLDPYIAGRDLQLTRDIQGDVDALKTGDAIVLKYTAELVGSPAIFLPPLAPDLRLEGVSVYADEPVIEEGAPARRIEKLTLVFNTGGEFHIPGINLDWWNMETNTIETASVAGFSIPVKGPLAGAHGAADTAGRAGFVVAWTVVGCAVVWFVLRRRVVGLWQRSRTTVERWRQSEHYAFNAFRKALRSGEPGNAYHAMLRWMERLEPGMDARRFARDFGEVSLRDSVELLSAAMYANASQTVDLRGLEAGFVTARSQYLKQLSTVALNSLPPLNP